MAIVINDARSIEIMRNAYKKLDNMPLGFGGMPAYSDDITDSNIVKFLGIDLLDTLRELRLNSSDEIDSGSYDEMMMENRVCYHTIRRFRLASSIFFKYSTATDGKTVDKTQIPKMISIILADYEAEFKKWMTGKVSSTWSKSSSLSWTPNDSGGYTV